MTVRPPDIRAKQWLISPALSAAKQQQFPDIPPILLQVLHNRDLKEAAQIHAFLEGQYLAADDPFLLADMDKAVARITQAIADGEQIAVYGDFDADGVTSTVLLTHALRGLGMGREQAQPYIPDRVDEGYGLNKQALTHLKEEKKVDLVITVDCGIRSVDEVAHANEIGLDMIVTDHHSLGRELPPAIAVINPNRPDSAYPDTQLAGVGVAYKLAQALHRSLPELSQLETESLLDLVAIGTVADMVPLLGENRRLVIDGLQVLNRNLRPGVSALIDVSKMKAGQISAESIAFGLAPRINAAGRLSHAYDAARLLACHAPNQARVYADKLENLNRQRQKVTQELGDRAETLVDLDAPVLIASDDQFISGVVGLVASRLTEKHYRPSIVLERGETESRASCRSIPEFHITNALDQLSDMLVRYGGHSQAAGFTIANDQLDAFTEAMQEIADDALTHRELVPTLAIDAEIGLDEIDWALLEQLKQLEPTGQKNPTPVFMSRGVQVLNKRVVGRDSSHLQMEVSDGAVGFKTIAFRQAGWAACMPRRIDIAYTVGVNEYRGRRTLQLMVKDIRATSDE